MPCGQNKTLLNLPATFRHNKHVVNYFRQDTGQSAYIPDNALNKSITKQEDSAEEQGSKIRENLY
jgi:hypothetical protein